MLWYFVEWSIGYFTVEDGSEAGGDFVSIQTFLLYRVFSHDVTAAILVSQNNKTAAMLVSQTSPVGVEFFSYLNALFCSNKFA